MSNPVSFILMTLIAAVLVAILGALLGGRAETQEPAPDPKDAEIAALEKKLIEMKRRAALDGAR